MTAVNVIQASNPVSQEQLRELYKAGLLDNTRVDNLSIFNNGYQTTPTYTSSSEGCTDGKDDGKIGLFSAIGNISKGVAKGAVNMLKGACCDENGNFSLLQVAKTAAIGAVCVAFPAVGAVAAGIGLVSGGTKMLEGIGKAMTASTDAEAKAAWQEVGDGGLTTGISAWGLKASVAGIKATSTSAKGLNSLKEGASILDKGKAFLHDAGSSTVNQFNNIKGGVQLANLRSKGAKIQKAQAEGTGLTQQEVNTLRQLDATETFSSSKQINIADGIQSNSAALKEATSHPLKTTGNVAKNAWNSAKNFKLSNVPKDVMSIPSKLKAWGANDATIIANLTGMGYTNAQAAAIIAASQEMNNAI